MDTLRVVPNRTQEEVKRPACFWGPLCLSFLICEPQDALEEQKEPGVGVRGPSSDASLCHAPHRGKTKIVHSQNELAHGLSAHAVQPIVNLERFDPPVKQLAGLLHLQGVKRGD